MWQMVNQILGTPWAGVTIPERMLMIAGALTAIFMLITGALSMITDIGKGGRR